MAPRLRLSRRDRVLVHQVHPAKLATDIGAWVVSNVLLWRRRLLLGLVVRYLAPPLGSALVLMFADLDRLAMSRRGRYVAHHMPATMVALRLAGDTLMLFGAWTHRWPWLAAGAVLVALGWSHGLLPDRGTLTARAAPAGR